SRDADLDARSSCGHDRVHGPGSCAPEGRTTSDYLGCPSSHYARVELGLFYFGDRYLWVREWELGSDPFRQVLDPGAPSAYGETRAGDVDGDSGTDRILLNV